MNKIFNIIVVLGILWGLLVWGNVILINGTNNNYQERMGTNYLVNSYDGRLLLSQDEYRQFKQDLLDPEVIIHSLDAYSSDDTLVIYHISAPESHNIYGLEKFQSQTWRYEQERGQDYFGFGMIILLSVAGGSLTSGFIIYIFRGGVNEEIPME